MKPKRLTSEGLAERLALLNASAVCDRAGVDYNRFKGWKLGRVKSLSDEELQRLAEVLGFIGDFQQNTQHTDTSR